jgi:signal transduction histidine kinase
MKNIFHEIVRLTDKKVQENGAQYMAFGLFVIATYPMYYFFWIYFSKQPYSNLTVRIIATLLCLLLALHKYWPQKAKKYLPLYWYITLLYCLPFFFTFMLLKNLFSPIWLANSILGLYFLMLLVDFKSFIVLFFLGAFLGALFAYFIPPPIYLNQLYPIDYFGITVTYLVSLVIGGMFARNREKIEQAKLQTMRSVGATVAHELRTPLAAIHAGITGAKQDIPILLEAYNSAKDHGLKVPTIQPDRLRNLPSVLNNIEDETEYSNTIINMILINAKQKGIYTNRFQTLSISSCIEEAITRYPFKSKESELIVWKKDVDFVFRGDKIFFIHVLFNLMKNALYYIEAEKKGKIYISCNIKNNSHVLYFKDTSRGISEKELPKLFEKFYTTTRHGTGLGLAYCKMVMLEFGGNIICKSKLGEYTQFELTFPKHTE